MLKKKFILVMTAISLTGCQLPWPGMDDKKAATLPDMVTIPLEENPIEKTGESEENLVEIWPYRNKKYNYEVNYPLNQWVINKSRPAQVVISYESSLDESVTGYQLAVEITETVSPDLKTLLKEDIYAARVEAEEVINGQTFARLSMVGTLGPGLQYLVIYDKKLYTISLYPFPVQTGDTELDGLITSQLDQMLRSFKFVEGEKGTEG